MFKSIKPFTLVLLLVLLGGIVLFKWVIQSEKDTNTFSGDFFSVDSLSITGFSIFPAEDHGKEIRFTLDKGQWRMVQAGIQTTPDSNAVKSVLSSIYTIKTKSLAARNPDQWKTFQVDDSAGTKVMIRTKDGKEVGFIAGKFSFNPGTRGGISFVRKNGENEVYGTDGFLALQLNRGFKSWRNNLIVQADAGRISSLTFQYPSDSSFNLSRTETGWLKNGVPADSTSIIPFIQTLSNLRGTDFADQFSPAAPPLFTLEIKQDQDAIFIKGYPGNPMVYHSSQNPDTYFTDNALGDFKRKIFPNSGDFRKK